MSTVHDGWYKWSWNLLPYRNTRNYVNSLHVLLFYFYFRVILKMSSVLGTF